MLSSFFLSENNAANVVVQSLYLRIDFLLKKDASNKFNFPINKVDACGYFLVTSALSLAFQFFMSQNGHLNGYIRQV